MTLNLREAVMSDMDILFEWANDPLVRANSFNTNDITYQEHCNWFKSMMQDKNAYQYMLSNGDEMLGQIRLNIKDSDAYISYSIKSDKRGMGLGKSLINLMVQYIINNSMNISTLIGLVKYENIASSKCFEECGFSKMKMDDCIEYRLDMKNYKI